MTTCVTVGVAPACVNVTAYRGDTYVAAYALVSVIGEVETLTDTSGLAARLMIRTKRRDRATNAYPVIAIADQSGEPDRGRITLGILGDPPAAGKPDSRSNVQIVIPAPVTETWPLVRASGTAEWGWDLQVWDPAHPGDTTVTYVEGDWISRNDTTYGVTP
jgi:hypothetical protein